MTDKKVIPFNPLHKRNLGENVCQAMLRHAVVPLSELTRFRGAGIYAIYYSGKFPAYKPIAQSNKGGEFTAPIYVGKAVPRGSRKGGELESEPESDLFTRLNQHARSITYATNLEIKDFHCRYLVVDDIWIPLAESLLIATFTPLWNKLVDGFGNHDPGKGRHLGLRPRWDVIHPGRPWADRCQPRTETAKQIIGEIRDYLRNNPVGESDSQ